MSVCIGDIAGQYDAFIRLVAKLPKDEPIILVGDLVDRGPKSRQVLDWVQKTPNVRAIRGNHEDLLIDYVNNRHRYDRGLYHRNGGDATLACYGDDDKEELFKHVAWLESLPLYIEEDGFFISHAPISSLRSIDEAKAFTAEEIKGYPKESGLLWNRDEPIERPGVIQVSGHNAQWSLKMFGDPSNPWAISLDDSWANKLTAYDTKTKQIYQESYI